MARFGAADTHIHLAAWRGHVSFPMTDVETVETETEPVVKESPPVVRAERTNVIGWGMGSRPPAPAPTRVLEQMYGSSPGVPH